jgi:hypothetical protein
VPVSIDALRYGLEIEPIAKGARSALLAHEREHLRPTHGRELFAAASPSW